MTSIEGVEYEHKPWGSELLFALTDKYAGKIITVNKGHRLSLQYHEKKEETMYVLSGLGKITTEDSINPITEGDVIHITPRTKHRVEAITTLKIVEVSTPELSDVVRIADDYGRTK